MNDGIHPNVPAETYHADLLGDDRPPTLSASIAKILLSATPAHAKAAHPRLNPNFPAAQDDPKYDFGTACHALILEGKNAVSVVHETSWRSNTAKAMREDARAAGKVPLLAHKWQEAQEMCAAVSQRPEVRALLDGGAPEQTLAWHEPNGVACRARLDSLSVDYITDVKTTSRSANPVKFSRTLYDLGYHVQAEFYSRGVERLTGKRPEFRLIVCETTPPYEVSVQAIAPAGWELAAHQVDYVLETWARCLSLGEWPGYDTRVAFAEPPPWLEAQWLEREAREGAAA